MVDPGNLLLMDEPTNHLDLESSEAMAEALTTYDGTLIFVSHNRSFVRHLATRIWYVHDGMVEEFPGTSTSSSTTWRSSARAWTSNRPGRTGGREGGQDRGCEGGRAEMQRQARRGAPRSARPRRRASRRARPSRCRSRTRPRPRDGQRTPEEASRVRKARRRLREAHRRTRGPQTARGTELSQPEVYAIRSATARCCRPTPTTRRSSMNCCCAGSSQADSRGWTPDAGETGCGGCDICDTLPSRRDQAWRLQRKCEI